MCQFIKESFLSYSVKGATGIKEDSCGVQLYISSVKALDDDAD